MPLNLPSRWEKDNWFWVFKCCFSVQSPFSSLIQYDNYSIATLWCLLPAGSRLLCNYIHIILLNCTTILLWKNYDLYFIVKWSSKRVKNFLTAPLLRWNSKFALSGFGAGGSVHCPLDSCFSNIIKCITKFICLLCPQINKEHLECNDYTLHSYLHSWLLLTWWEIFT